MVLSVNLKTAKARALLRAFAGNAYQNDLINRSLAIQQTQSGTTGANTGGAAEEFIAPDGHSLCDGSLLDGCGVQHRGF
jgi:hypothetical protein